MTKIDDKDATDVMSTFSAFMYVHCICLLAKCITNGNIGSAMLYQESIDKIRYCYIGGQEDFD